jgi:hypothetical protein
MSVLAAELPATALPRFAQELVRLVGYKATMELIRHFGGQRIRFAKTEGSAAFEALSEVVGPHAARVLGESLGDEERYIPKCFRAMKALEKRQIVARFDAQLAAGFGSRAACNLLAGEFGKSYRAIEIIVHSPLPEVEAPQQAALF